MMKQHKKNQGNSFIMVVATLSFLAVLVAAILVAVALCYKLKIFDLNSKDNFYYLEQAMDEIYAGVGTDSMKHLNEAYDDTIEVIVYYDPNTKTYVSMKNEDANDLFRNSFIKFVKEDDNYKNTNNVKDRFYSFLTNPYDATSKKDGVQISVGNVVSDADGVTIQNLILKREAKYSTINSRDTAGQKETFVQTITTDLVLTTPDISFNTTGADLSTLYQYAMIADMGIEITGASNNVNITGNLYAASDFYNKDYNDDKNKKLNSYSDTRLASCDGVHLNSMYSGIYIDGSNVAIAADTLVVPGSIAAMNSAELSIQEIDSHSLAQVWADNIVLAGYSLKKNTTDDTVQGSKFSMRAAAYIADDLEVNAAGSDFVLNGEYYGYNYASQDNRTYTADALKEAKKRTFVSAVPETIKDGREIEGQAHYNSSAIIVNGENSSLDLSNVSAMYIAGQSYIELSKKTTKYSLEVDSKADPGTTEEVTTYTYDYPEMSSSGDDNYTQGSDNGDKTNIQDYRTGEAISVKSNQLAYIPNWAIEETDSEIYMKLPAGLQSLDVFKDAWNNLDKIPVIKTVISGKTYYFFDFSAASTKSTAAMNEFIAAYAALFNDPDPDPTTGVVGPSDGESYGLTDITEYEYFEIKDLKLQKKSGTSTGSTDEYNIYSNSAISVKNGSKVTIKAKSSSLDALTKVTNNINNAIADQEGANTTSPLSEDRTNSAHWASGVTNRLQSQYKEMKWLLTNTSKDAEAVSEAHTLAESALSPINHYFKFEDLNDTNTIKLPSGYKIWLSDKPVEVEAGTAFPDGNVKGIVICKGDVTFNKDVKSFEGLIVTGAKILINQSMNITANEEVVKQILRECDESRKNTGAANYSKVCSLFKQYVSVIEETEGTTEEGSGAVNTEPVKTISTIQFEDILTFKNWKKNVD